MQRTLAAYDVHGANAGRRRGGLAALLSSPDSACQQTKRAWSRAAPRMRDHAARTQYNACE